MAVLVMLVTAIRAFPAPRGLSRLLRNR